MSRYLWQWRVMTQEKKGEDLAIDRCGYWVDRDPPQQTLTRCDFQLEMKCKTAAAASLDILHFQNRGSGSNTTDWVKGVVFS